MNAFERIAAALVARRNAKLEAFRHLVRLSGAPELKPDVAEAHLLESGISLEELTAAVNTLRQEHLAACDSSRAAAEAEQVEVARKVAAINNNCDHAIDQIEKKRAASLHALRSRRPFVP